MPLLPKLAKLKKIKKWEQQHPPQNVENQDVNDKNEFDSPIVLYTRKIDEEHPLFFITLEINDFLLHNCMLDYVGNVTSFDLHNGCCIHFNMYLS